MGEACDNAAEMTPTEGKNKKWEKRPEVWGPVGMLPSGLGVTGVQEGGWDRSWIE